MGISSKRPRQLGGCLRRVLFSNAGESNWTLPIQLRTIENHLRGYYLGDVCVFWVVYPKEELKWNYLAGFAMMVGAVFVIFKEW
jgi:uncharacterized protein (DUF486 family)